MTTTTVLPSRSAASWGLRAAVLASTVSAFWVISCEGSGRRRRGRTGQREPRQRGHRKQVLSELRDGELAVEHRLALLRRADDVRDRIGKGAIRAPDERGQDIGGDQEHPRTDWG